MKPQDQDQPHEAPGGGEPPSTSGEGSDTALQAMLRKRKMAEHPDHEPPLPQPG